MTSEVSLMVLRRALTAAHIHHSDEPSRPEKVPARDHAMPKIRSSDAEYARRRTAILERLAKHQLDALVVFLPQNVSYFSRFHFIPTERPIVLVLAPSSTALLVPRLEQEHAEEFALVERIRSYPEYPALQDFLEFS